MSRSGIFALVVSELMETVSWRFLFFRRGVGFTANLGVPGILRTDLVSSFLESLLEDAFNQFWILSSY